MDRQRVVTQAMVPGAVGLILGLLYLWEGGNYDRGTAMSPGPGAFPLAVGIVIVILSALSLVMEYRRPSFVPVPWGANVWRFPLLVLSVAAYIVLLKPAGYMIATFVLCVIMMRVQSPRSWRFIIVFSLATAVITYIVFGALGITMPRGVIPI